MTEQTQQFIPGVPCGDPSGNWQIDRDDFYKFIDEAFDKWHDAQFARSTMGSALPYELTALQPEGRVVAWRAGANDTHREWQRKVHPAVAEEAERLEAIKHPPKEECERQFSPSPLACYRAGFSEGLNREKRRANDDWGHNLQKYPDGRDGWAFMALKRTIQANGIEFAHELLDKAVASLEAQACAHKKTADPANVAVQSNGYVRCLECGALVPPSKKAKKAKKKRVL